MLLAYKLHCPYSVTRLLVHFSLALTVTGYNTILIFCAEFLPLLMHANIVANFRQVALANGTKPVSCR